MKYPEPKLFRPINPEKYIGDARHIVCRSGIEARYMKHFDTHPSVVRWASEELVIRYISPKDGETHRYFPDFYVEVRDKDTGKITKYILEVKPQSQMTRPKKGRNKKRYLEENLTYEINRAKWEAADAFCKRRGIIFKVVTEHNIKIRS